MHPSCCCWAMNGPPCWPITNSHVCCLRRQCSAVASLSFLCTVCKHAQAGQSSWSNLHGTVLLVVCRGGRVLPLRLRQGWGGAWGVLIPGCAEACLCSSDTLSLTAHMYSWLLLSV
jgi:hypothetical protein